MASKSRRDGLGPDAFITACAPWEQPNARSSYYAGDHSSEWLLASRLAELGGNADVIANARIMLEQARLLTLKAAWMLDEVGTKGARSEISQIKVAVPNIALKIIDQAIQMHGGAGVSTDFPLAEMFATIRTLRIADGPDEVHRALIAKLELGKYKPEVQICGVQIRPERWHSQHASFRLSTDRLTEQIVDWNSFRLDMASPWATRRLMTVRYLTVLDDSIVRRCQEHPAPRARRGAPRHFRL